MTTSFGVQLPDSKQADQAAFDLGTSFFEAAIRCLTPVQNPSDHTKIIAPVSPAIVSIAFSAELFLKSILMSQNKIVKHTHRLDRLFNDLNPESKKHIKRKACESKRIKNTDFSNHLSKLSNCFVDWRYVFEGVGEIDADVLFEITRSIYIYCKQSNPNWSVDEFLDARIATPLDGGFHKVVNFGGGRMIRARQTL